VFPETGRQLLVLSDRVEHTRQLYEMLPPEIRAHAGILGREVKSDERTALCNTKRILIATYSMCKEGFDLATLNTLLMATSRPDVDQIVGRILRIEKDKRKVHPLILDIVDPPFRRQFQERLDLYKKRNYIIEKTTL
jgi:superfamily II DNA or RNA helicase